MKFNVMIKPKHFIIVHLNLDDSIQYLYQSTNQNTLYFRNKLLNPNKLIKDYFSDETSEINIYPFSVMVNTQQRQINLKHKIEGLILLIGLYFMFLFYMSFIYFIKNYN